MPVSKESLLQSSILARCPLVRSGKSADAVDGVRPRLVVEPGSAEDVAALLAWASRERLTVVIRGGGTKLEWGRQPAGIDLMVCMRRLNRVLSHASADLTATVEAGATVDDVNATLARHRQWLPIDPSREGATIGGAVAANDTGPLRHRYGTPRDLLIGVQLATTDGRLVKAGGIVVKNVAGYDLGKLVSGSFGTLAAITTVTFKLLPMPDSWQTLAAAFPNHDGLAHAVTLLNDSQLEPVAVELQASPAGRHDPPYESAPYPLLVRFGGVPAAVAAQVGQARALIAAGEVLSGEPEAALWRRYQARAAASAGAVIKMSWLPAALPEVLAMVQEIAGSSRGAGSVELAGRAAVGSGLLKIDGATDWQAAVVDRLRARADVVRHVTLREATVALKDRVDVWGSLGPAATLGLAIKRALDPVGILNAGRGPI